ncbi:hypothetical protein SAMN05421505_16112 [Sinosporangium album]|uniref:Uncharacterized protein n=1 Tax=Sinosporangium album TaxID=504805 RepID=A0A1G8L4I0_9ACTN|nr:hypothetical protein [Sinosporangium album]SDI50604.1 hypothetical protein SAMN05421505_16112 [Sinosporangium album]
MAEEIQVWDAELAYGNAALQAAAPAKTAPPAADGAEPIWCVYQVAPASGMHIQHAFPHSAFEWRCAEYGLDPDDLDTLLDVVLYEPYLPDLGDLFAWQDPAAAAILEATRELPTCWTPGVSDETRLQAHLERIAVAKRHRVLITSAPRTDRQGALDYVGARRTAPPDPLAPIKEQTRLDPVRVRSRRLAVDWIRAAGAAPVRPTVGLKPSATFVGTQPAIAPPEAPG